ncbi:glycine oxidase ThiO [Silvibacterium dinghuense]|uniref:glycine oxidase ThiO n=1 Tax=Silvibacterium dinghuense TaxID=1560006 RepID=UPI0019AC4655|nr:glycine oxidase ThiO [Silvibacterium dinghuense]GGH16451.1 glycine oxidase ThiO [Silvibacterium dinghuense]
MNHTEIAIVGGGIIGLSLALELATNGRQVTILERESAASEASWAAAGMLADSDPENPAALQPLSRLSRSLWTSFRQQVEQLSGHAVPVRTRRTLQIAHHLPEGFTEASREEIDAVAPGLTAPCKSIFFLNEESINPRDLVAALPVAVRAAGVTLLEQTPVQSVRNHTEGVEIVTPDGNWLAGRIVYATGAWAGNLPGLPATPRKGQMIQAALDAPLDCVLRTPDIYIVPRGHGRFVIGATVEDAGFDKQVHENDIQALLRRAAALWPPVGNAAVVETWAGLRPGSPDLLPMLGPLEEERGEQRAWAAVGHYRNGILLAPGTARLLCEMLENRRPSIDPAPFRCDRFALSSVQSQCVPVQV